jgi:hypothetical protein
MKRILTAVLACAVLSGCAFNRSDIYEYNGSKRIYRFDVPDPGSAAGASNNISLINTTVAVLPFADHRNYEGLTYSTSIPFQLLAAKTISINAERYGVFRRTVMPDPYKYFDTNITMNAGWFNRIKKDTGAGAVLWGDIYSMDFEIEPGKAFNEHNLTMTIRGDIKIMLKPGVTAYYHTFAKKKSFAFKGSGLINYSLQDFDTLGPQIISFVDWVMKSEIDNIALHSKEITAGSLSLDPDLPPDVISFPSMKPVYSMAESLGIISGYSILEGTGGLVGAMAGFFITYFATGGSTTSKGYGSGYIPAFYGILFGFPAGMCAGSLITMAVTNDAREKELNGTMFYANDPSRYSKAQKEIVFYAPPLSMKF